MPINYGTNDVSTSGNFVASSGNFTSLSVNNTIVSVSGHTHTSSNITDFNSSVSGLLPTIANSGDNRILTSTGSTVGINAESNLTFDGTTISVNGAFVATSGLFKERLDFPLSYHTVSPALSGTINNWNPAAFIGAAAPCSSAFGSLSGTCQLATYSLTVNTATDPLLFGPSGDSFAINSFSSTPQTLNFTANANPGLFFTRSSFTSNDTLNGVTLTSFSPQIVLNGQLTIDLPGRFTAISGTFTYNNTASTLSLVTDGPGQTADVVRASGDARINGLVDNYGADALLLYNVGSSGDITLTHASGTANNQFLVPWLGDYVLSPNGGAALIVRDKTDNKWRIT